MDRSESRWRGDSPVLVSGYKRSIDLAGGRARIEQTRTPNFQYFQGQAPQKQVLGIDGDPPC